MRETYVPCLEYPPEGSLPYQAEDLVVGVVNRGLDHGGGGEVGVRSNE